MKKTISLTLVIALLCAMLAACGAQPSEPSVDPSAAPPTQTAVTLADWAGTWNAPASILGEDWMQSAWDDGAATISEQVGKTVTADDVRGIFEQMLFTGFGSCAIDGDTMTIYPESDLGGEAAKITFTYAEKFGMGEEDDEQTYWYGFTSSTPGYEYLIALPVEQDMPETMEHFHFRYGSDGFDALLSEEIGMWYATVGRQSTTQEQYSASMTLVISELPWEMIFGGE